MSMAIKFDNSSLGSVDYNLYNIDKFNGVDYTTTPTLVDDSRAIEISNYLPKGNSLVKRNGTSMVSSITFGGKHYYLHNMWVKDDKYYCFCSEKVNEGYINPVIITVHDLLNIDNIEDIYYKHSFDNYDYETSPILKEDDMYSFGTLFENTLFILCMGEYLMLRTGAFVKVEDYAYIPTIVTGLGDTTSTMKSSSFEEFNLLSDKCYIEITLDTVTEEKDGGNYDLAKFFIDKEKMEINEVNGIKPVVVKYEDIGERYDYFYTQKYGYFVAEYSFNEETKEWLYYDFTWDKSRGEEDNELGISYNCAVGEVVQLPILITYKQPENASKDVVKKMRFGVQYGSYGHRDRLFLSGNPEYPNMDIHSCEANDAIETWKDYTYFGDNSYAMIGSSDSAIKGYGFLNNGSMAVFKESKNNTPNLYFRTYQVQQDSEGNYKEIFPITISGLSIDVPVTNQIINYGNDVLVNTPRGIYKIMAGESTATQTYKSVEMSYFIRENLGNNISNSCGIVYNGKLYISREDVDGNKRVYVADENRYSFVDGKQVYEWFVLDNIDVDKWLVIDGKLYFSNDKGLFEFTNDNFVDDWFIEIPDANINGDQFSKEVFVNETTNKLILSSNNSQIQKILHSSNVENEWKNFKDSTKIKFGDEFFIERPNDISDFALDGTDYPIHKEYDGKQYVVLNIPYPNTDDKYFVPIVVNSALNSLGHVDAMDLYYYPHVLVKGWFLAILKVVYEDDGYKLLCSVDGEEDEGQFRDSYGIDYSNYEGIILCLNAKKQHFWLKTNELYDKNGYPLSYCHLYDTEWYYVGENGTESIYLGTKDNVLFNYFDLKFEGFVIDFSSLSGESSLREVIVRFENTVESYWRSKFQAFNRIDYLKTIDRTTFVADAVRGGKTNIGYKTTFRKSSSQTGFLYKNELDYKVKSANTEIIGKSQLDFNDVDFSYFTFSKEPFAQTYTTKKKVKNFSFVQLVFDSNEPEDSTIVSLSIRYKFTRNNKGVR
jgi:hypothetical protein